jgi:hypothetical protein
MTRSIPVHIGKYNDCARRHVLNRTALENCGVSDKAVHARLWVIDERGHCISMSDILSQYMYLHIRLIWQRSQLEDITINLPNHGSKILFWSVIRAQPGMATLSARSQMSISWK